MFAASIIFIIFAAISWAFFALIVYLFLTASLVLSYCCFWDEDERKQYCPHGLFHALIHDD